MAERDSFLCFFLCFLFVSEDRIHKFNGLNFIPLIYSLHLMKFDWKFLYKIPIV